MLLQQRAAQMLGAPLGRWLASPAALLLQLCPVPSTELIPMSWSHWDWVLSHKSWAAEPVVLAHSGWIHPCHGLTAPGRSQPLSQSTANPTIHHCSVTQVLQLVLRGAHQDLESSAADTESWIIPGAQLCIFVGFKAGCAVGLTV